jgi:hypothetical protein
MIRKLKTTSGTDSLWKDSLLTTSGTDSLWKESLLTTSGTDSLWIVVKNNFWYWFIMKR